MSMKVLIITSKTGDTKGMYQVTPDHIKAIKFQSAGIEVKTAADIDPDVQEKLLWADVLITSEFGMLNWQNSLNLKWVHLTSAGTNKVPDFIKNSKTILTNSSGVHPIPIAEHVFGLMLMLVRKIYLAHKVQIEKKEWVRSYELYQPAELYGSKLLIVGMGRIGERIAQIGEAFGMKVSAIVRDKNKKRSAKFDLFELNDLEKLVKEADFIVNCLPGIPSTIGIFNLALFKKFKKTAFIINIGRGTTIIEKDLIHVLEKGIIAGAGLDVFEVEPLPKSSKLWDLENVILTPHYSGWTPRYTDRVIDIFCQNLKGFLRGGKMPNLIDKKLGY